MSVFSVENFYFILFCKIILQKSIENPHKKAKSSLE